MPSRTHSTLIIPLDTGAEGVGTPLAAARQDEAECWMSGNCAVKWDMECDMATPLTSPCPALTAGDVQPLLTVPRGTTGVKCDQISSGAAAAQAQTPGKFVQVRGIK